MTRLKLVSTKIPVDWVDHLEESTRLTGLTQSALVRKAIGQYLGLETVDQVDRVDPYRSEIDDIKARLTTLERSTGLTMVDLPPTLKLTSPTPQPMPTLTPTGAMRTGELFIALQARGYSRSSSSLLRLLNEAIASGVVPDELRAFGVSCDFEIKRSAKPLAGNVKWLFLD